jgi:hypothetical protein
VETRSGGRRRISAVSEGRRWWKWERYIGVYTEWGTWNWGIIAGEETGEEEADIEGERYGGIENGEGKGEEREGEGKGEEEEREREED